MLYNSVKVNVPSRYHELIKKALEKKGKVSVKINLASEKKDDTLLLTRGQISKMERATLIGKKTMTIRMSRNQVQKNVKYEGGFLGVIIAAIASAIAAITAAAPAVVATVAAAASAAAPAIVTGAVGALAAAGVEAGIAKIQGGSGLYLRKDGIFARVQPVKGGGLYLSPHPDVEEDGDGLYLKHEGKTYKDIGKSPWIKEQVPIIGLLL